MAVVTRLGLAAACSVTANDRMSKQAAAARVALVTGAGRRIGRGVALDLARHGWAVGVHYAESAGEAESVVAAIAAAGGKAFALKADLADAAATASLLPACAVVLGQPSLLVNNAALFHEDRIETLEPALWDRQLAVNLRAPVLLAQAFASGLPANVQGNIINIIDQRVWRLTPHFFSYTTAKAALWTATQTMAQALAPRIRVNAIGPGPVLRSIHQSAADFDAEVSATILGVGTSPGEIAAAIRFILDAPAMTGQMIALDGGQHLAWRTPDIIGD